MTNGTVSDIAKVCNITGVRYQINGSNLHLRFRGEGKLNLIRVQGNNSYKTSEYFSAGKYGK